VRNNLPQQPNPVLQAILSKARKTNPTITERAVRYRIEDYRRKSTIVSKRLATNAYAFSEMDIDVQKLLNSAELHELQEWLKTRPQQVIREVRTVKKTERRQPANIRKKVVQTLGLPQNLSKEAQRMAETYPDMYLYENLVRHTVMTVLEKKHGKQWWVEPNVVSRAIRDTVEDRKKLEDEERWHSKRGSHEIFYTDFGDLRNIILTNINLFKPVFGDLEINADMKRLELSRNIIAHDNPLPPREVQRIRMALEDLQRQLDIYVDGPSRRIDSI
jgi:hypothetical protein